MPPVSDYQEDRLRVLIYKESFYRVWSPQKNGLSSFRLIISFATICVTVGIKVLKQSFTSEFKISRYADFEHFRKVFPTVQPCLVSLHRPSHSSVAASMVYCVSWTCSRSHRHVHNSLSNLLDLPLFVFIIARLPLESESWHPVVGRWWYLANALGVGKLLLLLDWYARCESLLQ